MHSLLVERWFGERFTALHPWLQQLHRRGGVLRGPVRVEVGRGIAGVLGRRLLKKLGIPSDVPDHFLVVEIHSDAETLHWNRSFDRAHRVESRFIPHGRWPEGYWLERTGPVELTLTVDVIDGGWYWRCLGVKVHGIRVPQALLPRTTGFKRIENDKYHFEVAFAFPLLGTVLSYRGDLDPRPN